LGLTIASRITWTLLECDVGSPEELADIVSRLEWANLFDVRNTFMVEGHCKDTFTTNSMFLALKVKDAVADAFRDAKNQRPNVDTRAPDVSLIARLVGRRLTIAVDLSGETLSNHGYRVADIAAPLRENLAAALIRAAGWNALANSLHSTCEPVWMERQVKPVAENKERRIPARVAMVPHFLDPMCGSGTLAIEAAMALINKKPNARRKNFAFEALLPFNNTWAKSYVEDNRRRLIESELDEDTIDERIERYRQALVNAGMEEYKQATTPISGSDSDAKAIVATRRNAATAGVDFLVSLSQTSFLDKKNELKHGLIVTNPPYGERLNDQSQVIELYAHMGDTLKKQFQGWTAWVISNDLIALKRVGLRPTRKLAIYNGPLVCQFQQFILY
jgi:23S rRNA G2445 N2-methylase RlmL